MPNFDETMANQSRIGEFVIFEFENPSKNILGFNHETKELSVSANYNRGAILELPEELYKNAEGNTPEKFWEFSMTIRMVLDTEDEWARLVYSGVVFSDGDDNLAEFKAVYWNQQECGVTLQINDKNLFADATRGLFSSRKFILGPFGNSIYPERPTEEERADMMKVYDWMTIKVKLIFRVTSDGEVTITYGNDSYSRKIDNFDIATNKPSFKVRGFTDAGTNVTYISNVIFSCE